MKSLNSSFACRNCRYYTPQGRRGGHCSQLNVDVQSKWKACALAIPPFTPHWESFEDIMVWQQKTLASQARMSPTYSESEPLPVLGAVRELDQERDPEPAMPKQVTGIKALWM